MSCGCRRKKRKFVESLGEMASERKAIESELYSHENGSIELEKKSSEEEILEKKINVLNSRKEDGIELTEFQERRLEKMQSRLSRTIRIRKRKDRIKRREKRMALRNKIKNLKSKTGNK